MTMRLHVLGLPWTQTTSEYLTCAYTQKVVKFCKMMTEQGFHVTLYSGEQNEAVCAEHVPLMSEEERFRWFGPNDQSDAFTKIGWHPQDIWWRVFNERAAEEIGKRLLPQDFLCLTVSTHAPIVGLLNRPDVLAVEWAVGYEQTLTGLRVFESYAWMHHVYGKMAINDGPSFDAVIPNFFDPEDFSVETVKDDYLLFVGRVIQRKGPHVAAMIAERAGRKLVVAGPGVKSCSKGRIETEDGLVLEGDVEYVGPVNAEERAALMGKAAVVLTPTQYIEPFGGVAIEAMLCGTPVIATDWGAFTETIVNGLNGYRFRTLKEGVKAVEKAVNRNPTMIAAFANRYTLDSVGKDFSEHFERLATLWGDGWYA